MCASHLVPDAEYRSGKAETVDTVDLIYTHIGPTNVPVQLSLPLVHHLRA